MSSMHEQCGKGSSVSSQMKRYCGERVLLRPISFDDTDLVVQWRNEPAVKSNLLSQQDINSVGHEAYLRSRVASRECDQFIIVALDTSEPVGSVFLKDIDLEDSEGEFGIFIGKAGRGRGFAKEATNLLLEHAFATLHLNRVYLTVFADNLPGIRAYERAGFSIDPTKTREINSDNESRTLLYMAIPYERFKPAEVC